MFSLDNRALEAFCHAAQAIPELHAILWINPVDDTPKILVWIEGPAKHVRAWSLKARL